MSDEETGNSNGRWRAVQWALTVASLLAGSTSLVMIMRRSEPPQRERVLRDPSGTMRVHLVADNDGAGIEMFDAQAKLRLALQENLGGTGLIVGREGEGRVVLSEIGAPSATAENRGEAAVLSTFGGASLQLRNMNGSGGSVALIQGKSTNLSIDHGENQGSWFLSTFDRANGPEVGTNLSVERISTAIHGGAVVETNTNAAGTP